MTPELEARYREPQRRYHTLAHIADCLAELSEVPGLTPRERRLIELALWWHDAVYDPTRTDNEEASADLARRDLAAIGEPPGVIDEVARLILLTKGHTVPLGDRLGAILVSIDLAILGREPKAYDRYAAQVREEYGFVPDDAFRNGRAAVMRKFLEAPAIYPDPAFRERYEARARANIAREIARLEA